MGNWGTKVARAGYPVETAADNQLLFSSSFPSLMVVQTGTLAQGASVAHNLGYNPIFFSQAEDTDGSGHPRTVEQVCSANTTTIYNNSNVGTARYYVFSRDIRTNYTAPNINTTPATQSTINQDYGFKVSQTGYDVTTAGLTNLVTFSGASSSGQAVRQLMVHQSGYQDAVTNGTTITVNHNLGYVPLFTTYIRDSSGQYFNDTVLITVNADSTLNMLWIPTITSTTLTMTNNIGNTYDFAWIIFKDPF